MTGCRPGGPPRRYADLGATRAGAVSALDAVAHAQAPGIDAGLAGEADTIDLVAFDLAAMQAEVAEAHATLDECFALLNAAGEAGG
ncbi:MAG: hypothetical protein M3Q03_02595 [Chloroflexota bacterium]|nr:hypothetical protein [Chloroflexota bacterium]